MRNGLGTGFDQPQSMVSFDTYLGVKSEGERLLCRQSPFMIRGLFHDVQSIKRLKSGDYLIETSSESQSRHYLQTKKVGEFPVKVIPHIGLNRVKGVVESDDLKYTNKEELLEEMKGTRGGWLSDGMPLTGGSGPARVRGARKISYSAGSDTEDSPCLSKGELVLFIFRGRQCGSGGSLLLTG